MANITNLAGAIVEYRATAATLFNSASQRLAQNPNDTDAQGKQAAAMSQLTNAETTLSAQLGRDGYAEVVKLMGTTATQAASIAAKLAAASYAITPGSTNFNHQVETVKALTGALQALAQLSPAAVWQKPTGE